jgi:hypothetical protein
MIVFQQDIKNHYLSLLLLAYVKFNRSEKRNAKGLKLEPRLSRLKLVY